MNVDDLTGSSPLIALAAIRMGYGSRPLTTKVSLLSLRSLLVAVMTATAYAVFLDLSFLTIANRDTSRLDVAVRILMV